MSETPRTDLAEKEIELELNKARKERDKWREMARELFEVLGQSETHPKWLVMRQEVLCKFEAIEKGKL